MHSIRGLNFTLDFMTEIFRQQSAFPQMQRFLSMISAEGSSGPKHRRCQRFKYSATGALFFPLLGDRLAEKRGAIRLLSIEVEARQG
jgi:hypothetical protein